MAIICLLINLYTIVIFGAILLSWFPMEPGTPTARLYTVLWRLTDPGMGPIRRTIPPVRLGTMALDMSPFIVLIGLSILRAVIGC